MRTIRLSERSRDKTLHIEAPGCIVNVQAGLHHDNAEVTRVDMIANGDRYAGDPEWWARGNVTETGSVTLVEQGVRSNAVAKATAEAALDGIFKAFDQSGNVPMYLADTIRYWRGQVEGR